MTEPLDPEEAARLFYAGHPLSYVEGFLFSDQAGTLTSGVVVTSFSAVLVQKKISAS